MCLHQYLSVSIQVTTDASDTVLAWLSVWGRCWFVYGQADTTAIH